MCEAHLAGTRRAAAAHKARRTYRMMRRAERAVAHKPLPRGSVPATEYTFVVSTASCGERRQNAGRRLASMDFPCPARRSIKILWPPAARSPWRAGPPAGPGHLQSPVRPGPAGCKGRGLCRFYGRFARQMAHCVQRRMDRVNAKRAGCRGLGRVFGGNEQVAHALLHRGQRHGQHARHTAHAAVQRKLADEGVLRAGDGQLPEAARMARKTGRSYTGPVLRISPGARLTVIRLTGARRRDRFFSALRTRSVALAHSACPAGPRW